MSRLSSDLCQMTVAVIAAFRYLPANVASTKIGVIVQVSCGNGLVYRLIYSSSSNIPPSEAKDGLSGILRVAQHKNHLNKISGALMLHRDRFAQIIEGPKENIKELFAKITEDDRHNNIEIFDQQEDVERTFESWTMALVGMDSAADVPLFASKSALVHGAPKSFTSREVALVDKLRQIVVS